MRTEAELTLAITAEAAPVEAVPTVKVERPIGLLAQERVGRTNARAEKTSKRYQQDELSKITLGMAPADLAQKMIDEFTVTLNSLTTGRANAITAAEKLLIAFEECSAALAEKTNGGTTYIANCIIALKESEAELTKPQTFTEKFHHGLISAIRALLNLFDRLYTWISGATKTMAENEDRKPYFPVPVTALGKEVTAFTNELSVLELEVAKDTAAAAQAKEEKELARHRPTPAQEEERSAYQAQKALKQQHRTERKAVREAVREAVKEALTASLTAQPDRIIGRAVERALTHGRFFDAARRGASETHTERKAVREAVREAVKEALTASLTAQPDRIIGRAVERALTHGRFFDAARRGASETHSESAEERLTTPSF